MTENDIQILKTLIHRRIGKFLKHQRNRSGLTIEQVAELLGTESTNIVRTYEGGEIPLCELARLTGIYHTSPAVLHRMMLNLQIDIYRFRSKKDPQVD